MPGLLNKNAIILSLITRHIPCMVGGSVAVEDIVTEVPPAGKTVQL